MEKSTAIKRYELIHLKGFMYAVDKEADLETDEWCFEIHEEYLSECPRFPDKDDPTMSWWLRQSNMAYRNHKVHDGFDMRRNKDGSMIKVAATNDPSLNLPMLPEMIENVNIKYDGFNSSWAGVLESVNTFSDKEMIQVFTESIKGVWRTAYILGHKAAKAKQFAEEDLLKYIEARMKFYRQFLTESIKSGEYKNIEKPFEWLEAKVHKAAVQSLKPLPIAVELETQLITVTKTWYGGNISAYGEIVLARDENNFVKPLKWIYEI